MHIWAIADLHLSFGIPNKDMAVFGSQWVGYTEKIATHWKACVSAEDLVLISGDISWAATLEEALPHLQWVDALPGTKVLIKGNHDPWWSSLNKVLKVLPPSLHVIQNNAFIWKDVYVAGARLWDSEEYQFDAFIDIKPNPRAHHPQTIDAPKIFSRELQRLELSLKALPPKGGVRIAMTHYPPIGASLQPSRASALLEKYHIQICTFGHLHSLKPNLSLFGQKNAVRYYLTSCDYLNFQLLKIL